MSAGVQRAWSAQRLYEMFMRLKVPYKKSACASWTAEQWNDAGDWAYYMLHPREPDPRRNRQVPPHVQKFYES